MRELEGHEITAIVNLLQDSVEAGDITNALRYEKILRENNERVLDYYEMHGDRESVDNFREAFTRFERDTMNYIHDAIAKKYQKDQENVIHPDIPYKGGGDRDGR